MEFQVNKREVTTFLNLNITLKDEFEINTFKEALQSAKFQTSYRYNSESDKVKIVNRIIDKLLEQLK